MKIDFNLIDVKNRKVLKSWNMDESYKEQLHLVFNNDIDKIQSGEYKVVFGTLPKHFEIDAKGNVVEVEEPKGEKNGNNIRKI